MKNIEESLRTATFRTVVTYVSQDLELVAEGSVKGIITRKIKGDKGFGYDPIFYVKEYNKTFAEMDINEKQTCSHKSSQRSLFCHRMSSKMVPVRLPHWT